MKKPISIACLLLCLAMALAACAGTQIKTPDKMTPTERGAFVLVLYNNAFANYHAQYAATPQPMGAEVKDYFRAYKRAMESAWPVISAYAAIVNVGGIPTAEQEQQIISLIYQMQAMLLQGGAK